MKLILIAVLLVPTFALAQLPDAPVPQVQNVVDLSTEVHNTPSQFKEEGRGKKKLLVLAAVEAFAIGADIYDVRASERAFKLGYVEQNGYWLCKDNDQPLIPNTCRPSARALYTRDLATLAIATTPAVLGYIFHRPEFFYGFQSAPVMWGIKHIQGGYKGSHLK